MAWLVHGCGAGGQKSWQSRVTQTPLRGANPFSFANCNINLSNAQPFLEDGQGSGAFPVSGEVAKGWKKQTYKLPATEKVLIPALVGYTGPSTTGFLGGGMLVVGVQGCWLIGYYQDFVIHICEL